MANKICLVYNYAQHYRTNIFTLMDQQMNIDFIFGDKYLNVKKMDYSLLMHKVTEVKNKHIGSISWQAGVVKLAFKEYDKLIMLGSPMSASTWFTTIIARMMGKKVYYWTHGWYGKESLGQSLIKKIFFRLPNGLLLYGNYARELMLKEGFKESKLITIHNSLMYDEQIKIRASLTSSAIYKDHFGNDNPVIIFVGRLTPIKKLDQILEAQATCKVRGFDFNVVYVGDGTEKVSIENKIESLELRDRVWLYGPSYDEKELSGLIYNADLCVAPGNIGLTAMHAMVYGCPCMSHNDFPYQMPEFEAIQEGMTGGFFERDNVTSLADSIQKWFAEHQQEREQIRQNCYREIDEQWNPHVQVEIIKKAIGL